MPMLGTVNVVFWRGCLPPDASSWNARFGMPELRCTPPLACAGRPFAWGARASSASRQRGRAVVRGSKDTLRPPRHECALVGASTVARRLTGRAPQPERVEDVAHAFVERARFVLVGPLG